MPFTICYRDRDLACLLAVPLRVQARLVLGNSRTRQVVAGVGWGPVLFSKPQTCFVGSLQTLASLVLKLHRRSFSAFDSLFHIGI